MYYLLDEFIGSLSYPTLTVFLPNVLYKPSQQRTKNENAEKIWAELQRRKTQSESGTKTKKQKTKQKSNRKMSKKNRKRLDALSEVIVEDDHEVLSTAPPLTSEASEVPVPQDEKSSPNEGIFGKVKDFYAKADQIAQSQALILNKELEDRGVVEKITDETGLKVIGKEEAAKLKNKNKGESDKLQ